MKSAWKHLQEHPPAMVRLLARRRTTGKSVRAMTLQEIAITSGLAFSRTTEISQKLSWDGVDIPEAERFCAGCHFDPLSTTDRNRQKAYARACRRWTLFAYLKKHPLWHSEFEPLINRLRSQRAS